MREPAALAARPPSVAEWEDLLVRLEIMPRALRNAVDDGAEGEPLREVMRTLVERELALGRWLEAASGFGGADAQPGAGPDADALALFRRFASLRARNFAMLQRRGLDVWDWSGAWEGAQVTVFQLLTWLLERDREALDAARAAAAGRPC